MENCRIRNSSHLAWIFFSSISAKARTCRKKNVFLTLNQKYSLVIANVSVNKLISVVHVVNIFLKRADLVSLFVYLLFSPVYVGVEAVF